MSRLRRIIAVWAAKATGFACRITGKQGVTLAGQIALKIDPDILKELSGQVQEKIFVTCGPNVKTTPTNLLCPASAGVGKRWSATIRAPICSTVWQQPSPRTLP